MTHMKTITAIIPVRAGSTRLKNKNVAPFAGTNLLVNKINQLKQVKDITKIVVSSDSDLMLEMAKAAGATEDLKARDPMRWVGLMNCCKAQVEEIIFAELIYI